jgi:hypothetical protein
VRVYRHFCAQSLPKSHVPFGDIGGRLVAGSILFSCRRPVDDKPGHAAIYPFLWALSGLYCGKGYYRVNCINTEIQPQKKHFRILGREVVRRADLGPKEAKVLTDTDVDR